MGEQRLTTNCRSGKGRRFLNQGGSSTRSFRLSGSQLLERLLRTPGATTFSKGREEKTADLSLRKFFNLTEPKNLGGRAAFFMACNHAVFSQPEPLVTGGPGSAGVITSTGIPQRQIQFALKFHF